jgi:anti-anti-sigma regulatory factor
MTYSHLETSSSTTLKALSGYSKALRKGGNTLMLVNAGPRVMTLLEDTGVMEIIGRENVFPEEPVALKSLDNAVEAADRILMMAHK